MDADTSLRLLWLADNVAGFAGHVAVVLVVVAIAAALTGSPRTALILLIVGAPFCGLVVASALTGAPVRACTADGPRLRVATINLLASNRDSDAVLAFIDAVDPDVVATQETRQWWADRLAALADRYPYRVRSRSGTVWLMSRRPFVGEPAGTYGRFSRIVGATFDIDGSAVTIAAVHLTRPVSVRHAGSRRAQMRAIAAVVRARTTPVVVLGDFNASLTSLDFRSLIARTALRAPALQIPPVSSWPSRLPGLGLQIDHVLATEPLRFDKVEAGPDVGSDHLPVVADLVLDPDGLCAR